MEIMEAIRIEKIKNSKLKEKGKAPTEFGNTVSDHMFICKYVDGNWQQPKIEPFRDLSISPLTLALHYGQSLFEGMKAFRMKDGRINIFRVKKHHERLNRSLFRMCMPDIPFELFESALRELVQLDRDWVPNADDSALYIRPLVFASEARFGVKVSDEYHFLVMTGPVPTLYKKPIKVKVEKKFIRAAKGGTGYAKCAGNYGAAFYPTSLAKKEGFDQVIWTDAFEHEYFEESGTMNLMFLIDGTLITPPVSDSILDGITRDSLLQIAIDLNIPVEERAIGSREIIKAFEEKRITEAFGAGTAAVVAPISGIGIDQEFYALPPYNENSIMFRLKKELDGIRTGLKEDRHQWNTIVG